MKSDDYARVASPSFLPGVAVLEMTFRCNHSCIFCSCPWFAPEKNYPMERELDPNEWKAIITKLCSLGVNQIALTGGEPLLKEGLKEIIRHAAACKASFIEEKNNELSEVIAPPRLYLLSNGLEMTNDMLRFCQQYKIKLSFSLPGLATFKEHTGIDNAPGVLSWFTKARKLGMSTTVGVTVTRRNLHELYETIASAFIAGADTLLMNRFMPGGSGKYRQEELFLDIPHMKVMLDTAEAVLNASRRPGGLGTEIPKCIYDPGRFSRLRVASRCSAAKEFFVIDPAGYLRVCNHSEVRLNHFSELDKIPDHPYWRTFVFREYLPSACAACETAKECDGGCREAAHIVGKRVDALDPVFGNETEIPPMRKTNGTRFINN